MNTTAIIMTPMTVIIITTSTTTTTATTVPETSLEISGPTVLELSSPGDGFSIVIYNNNNPLIAGVID